MKNFQLLALFILAGFQLSANSGYQVIIQGHLILEDGSTGIGKEVIFTFQDQSSNSAPELITRTDSAGYFQFKFETEEDQGCGLLGVNDCSNDFYPIEVCYSRDLLNIELELPYCFSVDPCVPIIHIDQHPLASGMIELVLALPEDREYDVLWNTGETTLSIIGTFGEEYCVIVSTPDCVSERCVVAGYNDECMIKIHQEWSADGVAILFAESYGQDILEYHWSNGSAEPFIEVRDSGEYCLEAILSNGCIARECIQVEPWNDECRAYIYEKINDAGARCLGVEIIWGYEITEYLWSTGESTATIIPDSTGQYRVTISTDEGCTYTAEYYFVSSEDCSVEIHLEPGWEPGIAGVLLFAESQPVIGIDYSWSTGELEPFIVVDENGEYCVTVTNDYGCEASHCIVVDLDSIWNGHCEVFIDGHVDEEGVFSLTANGWYPPGSSIEWSTGETGKTIYPVQFGEYCVTVSNENACYVEACYYYGGSGDCQVDVLDVTHEGVTYLYPHPYGVPPFTYEWSDGTVGDYITIASSGEYCLTMTDATGCVTRWCGTITLHENEFCEAYITKENDANGNVYYLVHTEGGGPYEYYWSDDRLQGDSVTIVDPGFYCVEVIDTAGCVAPACIDVFPVDPCTASIRYYVGITGDTLLYIETTGNAAIEVKWDNGSTDYEIKWEGVPVCAVVSFSTGCTSQICFEGFQGEGVYHITGMVSDPELDYLPDLEKVTFYYLITDSSIVEVDAEIEIVDNAFQATLTRSGQYLIKADVDGYVPTYYQHAIHWQDAIPIGVDDATVALVYEIFMVRENESQGEGKVSGSVVAGDNSRINLGYRDGDPYEGAEIILTTLDGIPIQAVYTDANGNFLLEGIPVGTYYVILEVAGYPQQRVEVIISEEQPIVEGLVFEYGPEGADNTSGIDDKDSFYFTLFPNPTSDIIQVRIPERGSGNIHASIMDINGRLINTKIIPPMNQKQFSLDVSRLDAGSMYMLRLMNQHKIAVKKFFIAKR